MPGRVLRQETRHAPHGAYMGAQCPDCPVVVQPLFISKGEHSTLAEAMDEHRRIVHPGTS